MSYMPVRVSLGRIQNLKKKHIYRFSQYLMNASHLWILKIIPFSHVIFTSFLFTPMKRVVCDVTFNYFVNMLSLTVREQARMFSTTVYSVCMFQPRLEAIMLISIYYVSRVISQREMFSKNINNLFQIEKRQL